MVPGNPFKEAAGVYPFAVVELSIKFHPKL